MSTGAVFTKNGFNAMIEKAFSSTSTKTVPSRFGIGTGTTTPVVTDTALETKIATWSGGSDYKNYVSGFPTFDTANQKVTVQGFVASTEANGNTITEYGDFNTDGTPILSSHCVVTGLTKTSAVQIYFTTTYKRA